MCTTTTTTTGAPAALDPILYAAALAVVKAETEARSAVIEREVTEARAALLAAVRNTVRHGLPAGHALQPLAELVADSVTIGEDRSVPILIPAAVVSLVSLADGATLHNVDALCLWSILPRVGAEERAYRDALERKAHQATRLQRG